MGWEEYLVGVEELHLHYCSNKVVAKLRAKLTLDITRKEQRDYEDAAGCSSTKGIYTFIAALLIECPGNQMHSITVLDETADRLPLPPNRASFGGGAKKDHRVHGYRCGTITIEKHIPIEVKWYRSVYQNIHWNTLIPRRSIGTEVN